MKWIGIYVIFAACCILLMVAHTNGASASPATVVYHHKNWRAEKMYKLDQYLRMAQENPLLKEAISCKLQKIGFTKENAERLIQEGTSTLHGKTVTVNDVSKFCCPL